MPSLPAMVLVSPLLPHMKENQLIVGFFHIDGKENPADIQTKTLPCSGICCQMKPLLHWGDRKTSPQDHDQQMGSVRNQELPILWQFHACCDGEASHESFVLMNSFSQLKTSSFPQLQ